MEDSQQQQSWLSSWMSNSNKLRMLSSQKLLTKWWKITKKKMDSIQMPNNFRNLWTNILVILILMKMSKISISILVKYKTKLIFIKKIMEAECLPQRSLLIYWINMKKKNKIRFQRVKLNKWWKNIKMNSGNIQMLKSWNNLWIFRKSIKMIIS